MQRDFLLVVKNTAALRCKKEFEIREIIFFVNFYFPFVIFSGNFLFYFFL